MQATEFHLYRVKFIKPAQGSLFFERLSARDFFESALQQRPTVELRENSIWHIGNIEHIDEAGGRFAIGRTTKTTVEKFDSDSGNFIEELDDSGPYTFVYFDIEFGFIGIARRTKVAPTVKSIARKIQLLFSSTELARQAGIDVRVDLIPDPESFLKKLHQAYAIKRFLAHFTGPNPIDADELFQKPMSFYCQKMDAVQGSVSVSGDALNEEAVAAVAKSTAATGNHASALIQPRPGTRLVSISFQGDAAKVVADSDTHKDEILTMIREGYFKVRK
jgi:hypothetical protein